MNRTSTRLTRSLALALLAAAIAPARAAQIELQLRLDYAGTSNQSGGSWRLLARTDSQGLYSLRAPIAGINPSVASVAPTGRVNGSAVNNAGFSVFANTPQGGFRDLFFAQSNTTQGQGQQGLFYGVGTLTSGAPNFPSRPAGTSTLGPSITSLTNVSGAPWGVDSLFPRGVTLATGTFAAGIIPSFSTQGVFEGAVLTTVGSISVPGTTNGNVTFLTSVTDDLSFGVATGDYNADGRVNAADYTRYRDTLGQSVTALTGADGDGNGLIGAGDLSIWRTNYGRVRPAVAAVAIPEPTADAGCSFLLALAASARGQRVPEKIRQTRSVA